MPPLCRKKYRHAFEVNYCTCPRGECEQEMTEAKFEALKAAVRHELERRPIEEAAKK